MNSKIYYLICVLCFLFFSVGCSDDNNNPLNQEFSEIKNHLSEVGELESKPMVTVSATKLGEKDEAAVRRYDDYGEKMSSYIPRVTSWETKGVEPISDIFPTTSADVMWPGNLIQGKSVASGELVPIRLEDSKRKSGRVYFTAISGQAGMKYHKDIQTLSGSNVTQAINEILSAHVNNFPADISYAMHSVHSKEEMAYYLDMNTRDFNMYAGSEFNAVKWNEKTSKIMIRLDQSFFTVAYEFPGLEDLFSENMHLSDLEPYTEGNNPPCYISTVSYGRRFVLIYEADVSRGRLMEAIRKIYGGSQAGELTSEDLKVLRRSNVFLRQTGGDGQAGLSAISNEPQKVKEFVENGANVSKTNVGAPISYTVKYLLNSQPVKTYKTLDIKYQDVDYIKANEPNNIEIEIKDIRSSSNAAYGGSLYTYGSSTYTKFNIEVITPENKVVKTITSDQYFYLGLNKFEAPCYVFKIGQLGENTKNRIVFQLPNLTYEIGYGREVSWPNRPIYARKSYDKKRIEFAFDEATQRWKVYNSDDFVQNIDFKSINIKDKIEGYDVNFSLGYIFRADGVEY